MAGLRSMRSNTVDAADYSAVTCRPQAALLPVESNRHHHDRRERVPAVHRGRELHLPHALDRGAVEWRRTAARLCDHDVSSLIHHGVHPEDALCILASHAPGQLRAGIRDAYRQLDVLVLAVGLMELEARLQPVV